MKKQTINKNIKKNRNNQICALKTIWFNEITVCVFWNAIHLLNETTKSLTMVEKMKSCMARKKKWFSK